MVKDSEREEGEDDGDREGFASELDGVCTTVCQNGFLQRRAIDRPLFVEHRRRE